MKEKLPEVGTRIPVEKFHVSLLNVRFGEPFGKSKEDRQLISNLTNGRIIAPFKARPENEKYGVFVGRRRFLAKKALGAKYFVVGEDCLIEIVTNQEAREASLIENLEIFRKSMDPIARAKGLKKVIDGSNLSLRTTAKKLGIPRSNLSDWLKVLELSPRMQKVLSKGLLNFTNGLLVAKMKLGEVMEEKLAETLEAEGFDVFKKELERINVKKLKRGIPKGAYTIVRTTWDTNNKKEMEYYELICKIAEKRGLSVGAYTKDFLIRHIDQIMNEKS